MTELSYSWCPMNMQHRRLGPILDWSNVFHSSHILCLISIFEATPLRVQHYRLFGRYDVCMQMSTHPSLSSMALYRHKEEIISVRLRRNVGIEKKTTRPCLCFQKDIVTLLYDIVLIAFCCCCYNFFYDLWVILRSCLLFDEIFSRFSKSFDDLMACRWWNSYIGSHYTL